MYLWKYHTLVYLFASLACCEQVCRFGSSVADTGTEPQQPQGWLSTSLDGLLANIMFEYAILLGISVR
jgi:hypothetical protein